MGLDWDNQESNPQGGSKEWTSSAIYVLNTGHVVSDMEPKDVLSVYSSIGQTNLDSIPRQLVVVGGADDDVPLEPGIGDLEADIHF